MGRAKTAPEAVTVTCKTLVEPFRKHATWRFHPARGRRLSLTIKKYLSKWQNLFTALMLCGVPDSPCWSEASAPREPCYPKPRCAFGPRLFRNNVASTGSSYPERFEAAGLITLGKASGHWLVRSACLLPVEPLWPLIPGALAQALGMAPHVARYQVWRARPVAAQRPPMYKRRDRRVAVRSAPAARRLHLSRRAART